MEFGAGAFKMNPWTFFLEQLTGSLTTDLKLLWSHNNTGLDTWASTVEDLVNYFMRGTQSYENVAEDVTKNGYAQFLVIFGSLVPCHKLV